MDKIAIQKELMKEATVARFSHYQSGNLYYSVEFGGGDHLFPVPVVDEVGVSVRLSEDLGATAFVAEERATLLFRWISKAIDAETLRKL